jgi:small subunit ribosomal protein S5
VSPPPNMSASRSYQCLSCRFKDLSVTAPKIARRQFHATIPKPARKSAFPNVSADKLGLTEPAVEHSYARVRPYTKREKQLLAMKYTPDQMEAIEVGEASIGDEDLRIQGRPRTDPMRISYFDDFSKVRPMIDFPVEAAQEESVEELLKSAPKFAPTTGRKPPQDDKRQLEEEDLDPRIMRLSQQTGLTPKEIKRLRVKNLVNHRVVNQTRMGKIQSLYFLTIAGNENGMLGIGEGKAAEDEDGRRQAMMNAIRNMKPVPRYEERTIYGDVEAKVGASVVQLSARSPGMYNSNIRETTESNTNNHPQASATAANTSSTSSPAPPVSQTLPPALPAQETR